MLPCWQAGSRVVTEGTTIFISVLQHGAHRSSSRYHTQAPLRRAATLPAQPASPPGGVVGRSGGQVCAFQDRQPNCNQGSMHLTHLRMQHRPSHLCSVFERGQRVLTEHRHWPIAQIAGASGQLPKLHAPAKHQHSTHVFFGRPAVRCVYWLPDLNCLMATLGAGTGGGDGGWIDQRRRKRRNANKPCGTED